MLVNEYAAMPSLHFGWNLLVGIAIVQCAESIPRKILGVVMPTAMLYAIVATGNHFVMDGVMGAAVALIGLLLAISWHPNLQRWDRELWQHLPKDAQNT
jgi:membrane-associated phospholipid phosphatase